jgi:hypothetical protein
MITLTQETIDLIKSELEHIPDEYQKPFNSKHEGLAVLQEEFEELKDEIFFGRKKAFDEVENDGVLRDAPESISDLANEIWKQNIREEAVQVAAMAARIIQELT